MSIKPLSCELFYDRSNKTLAARHYAYPEACQERIFLEQGQAGVRLSALVRLIRRRNKSPMFLICLESKDTMEPLTGNLRRFGLTRREREVAHMVCKGLRNNEISDRLYISVHTVENHLRSVYRKLGVCNRTSVVHRVMGSG